MQYYLTLLIGWLRYGIRKRGKGEITSYTHGATSQGWQKPGFLKKNPARWVFLGFIGFYWVLLGVWVFLNFRLITDIFLPIFGLYKFFISKKYLM
jgi:hypothetical protein